MFADVVTARDASSDSDSDEYFDPLEFSTIDESDEGDKFVSDSDSDDSDSESQFFDAEQPKSAVAHKSVSGKAPAAPQPTALPSPKLKTRSQNEIQRRTSLVGMSLTRRPSIPATVVVSAGKSNFDETLSTVPAGFKHREALPADKNFKVKVSLMKILKDSIGKDLSRITIPVQFAEPTNLLQRLVEDMQYIDVLENATKCNDSLKRLAYIAAFAAGGYAATINRLGKPFNPILGETYEWVNKDVGFRLISEQVSHHPQISALHAEGRDWVVWTTIFTKNKCVALRMFIVRSWNKFSNSNCLFSSSSADSGVSLLKFSPLELSTSPFHPMATISCGRKSPLA
jgi:oxysterol-binding protein 1